MKNIITLSNVSKSYGDFELKNVSFNIPSGAIVGMIGSNGSGKTTIIKSILNLIDVDSGTIEVLGLDNKKSKSINEKIGVVFDECNFPDNYTINILNKIFKNMYMNWDVDLFYRTIDKFQLNLKKKIGSFSKGMKMKLSIATALAHHPQLLILDEAMVGLDPIARDEMIEILYEFMEKEENSIFITSHITTDLEKISDYIMFIEKGEVLWFEETSTLLDQYGILRCDEETFGILSSEDILKYRKQDFEWSVLIKNRSEAEQKYQKCIVDKPSIEEIMLLYVKGENI